MATQTSVPGTEENKATRESSSETTLNYASSLRLLQQTVTRHLWNVSDYVIDGGVHVLGRLETGQGSARRLRGGGGTQENSNSTQACKSGWCRSAAHALPAPTPFSQGWRRTRKCRSLRLHLRDLSEDSLNSASTSMLHSETNI